MAQGNVDTLSSRKPQRQPPQGSTVGAFAVVQGIVHEEQLVRGHIHVHQAEVLHPNSARIQQVLQKKKRTVADL